MQCEEETGFDCSRLIDPKAKFETYVKSQSMTMFFVTGVDENTKFGAQTRKEIGVSLCPSCTGQPALRSNVWLLMRHIGYRMGQAPELAYLETSSRQRRRSGEWQERQEVFQCRTLCRVSSRRPTTGSALDAYSELMQPLDR